MPGADGKLIPPARSGADVIRNEHAALRRQADDASHREVTEDYRYPPISIPVQFPPEP